jgi:hypothetical protein
VCPSMPSRSFRNRFRVERSVGRFGRHLAATVRITVEQLVFRENLARIQVLGTYKRRLADSSAHDGEDGLYSTLSPATALRQALRAITSDDGNFEFTHPLPIVMGGTITTQPPVEEPPPPPPVLDDAPSGPSKSKKKTVGLAGGASSQVGPLSVCARAHRPKRPRTMHS